MRIPIDEIKWTELYKIWKRGIALNYPYGLDIPVERERIEFKSPKNGEYIFGYYWGIKKEITEIKKRASEDPIGALYMVNTPLKGVMHTAQMLCEAKDEEEIAAIWIAASAIAIGERYRGTDIGRYMRVFENAANSFLKDKFFMWHHAMKTPIPDVVIPYEIAENLKCEDADTAMKMLQMGVLAIQRMYQILVFSSISEEKEKRMHSIRIDNKIVSRI